MDGAQPAYEESSPQQPASLFSGKNIFLGLGAVIIILLIILAVISNKNKPSTPQQVTSTAPTAMEEPTPYLNPSETGGSYTSPTHGFAFSYPPQFIAANTNPDIVTVSSSNTPRLDPDAPAVGLQITVTQGDNAMAKLDIAKDLFESPVIKNTIIDGTPAKELSGSGNSKGMLSGKFISFVEVYKNGQTIEFAYFEGDPNFTPEILNNILTSFKFTK